MSKRHVLLMYGAMLALFVVVLWLNYEDREPIFAALSRVGLQGFLFLCLLSSLNYTLRYLRWNIFLTQFGNKIDWWSGLLSYLSGFALTATPAKAGETLRCFYFKRNQDVAYSQSLASLFTERIMDALVVVQLGSLALFTFESVRWLGFAFSLCIVLAVLLVSQWQTVFCHLNHFALAQITIVRKILDLAPTLFVRANQLLKFKPMTLGMGIGLIAWSAEGFAFAWLVQELGGSGSTLLYISIFSVAAIAGALTFLPGGLGGTEAVLYMLTVATGMEHAEALTATLLIRLATLWYAVFLGLLSLLWLETSKLFNGRKK